MRKQALFNAGFKAAYDTYMLKNPGVQTELYKQALDGSHLLAGGLGVGLGALGGYGLANYMNQPAEQPAMEDSMQQESLGAYMTPDMLQQYSGYYPETYFYPSMDGMYM